MKSVRIEIDQVLHTGIYMALFDSRKKIMSRVRFMVDRFTWDYLDDRIEVPICIQVKITP